MSGALIGGLVLGGMAGAGGALLSAKKKTTALPVTGITDTAEGRLYKQTLEDRLAGIGLRPTSGYDPGILNASTAPYATSQRASFKNYTMPVISGQASARGLGRSTIPVSQARLGSQEVEDSIAQRVALLTLANEEEKAREVDFAEKQKDSALTSYGALAGDVTAGQNAKNASAWNAQNINDKIAYDNQQNLIGSTVSGAVGGMSGVGGGSTGFLTSLLGNFNSSQNNSGTNSGAMGISASDLADYWANRNKASVKIA